MEALARQSERDFENRLVEHVRTRRGKLKVPTPAGGTAVAELPESEIRQMVRLGIAKARQYGMTWQSSVAAFTVLMFDVGPSLDQHPTVRAELTHPDVPDQSRVEHLVAAVPATVWQEVRKSYDGQAWSSACGAKDA
jgi:hypothetical protein